jgi:hypothetical protein
VAKSGQLKKKKKVLPMSLKWAAMDHNEAQLA